MTNLMFYWMLSFMAILYNWTMDEQWSNGWKRVYSSRWVVLARLGVFHFCHILKRCGSHSLSRKNQGTDVLTRTLAIPGMRHHLLAMTSHGDKLSVSQVSCDYTRVISRYVSLCPCAWAFTPHSTLYEEATMCIALERRRQVHPCCRLHMWSAFPSGILETRPFGFSTTSVELALIVFLIVSGPAAILDLLLFGVLAAHVWFTKLTQFPSSPYDMNGGGAALACCLWVPLMCILSALYYYFYMGCGTWADVQLAWIYNTLVWSSFSIEAQLVACQLALMEDIPATTRFQFHGYKIVSQVAIRRACFYVLPLQSTLYNIQWSYLPICIGLLYLFHSISYPAFPFLGRPVLMTVLIVQHIGIGAWMGSVSVLLIFTALVGAILYRMGTRTWHQLRSRLLGT